METTSLDGFYQETAAPLPDGMHKEVGHFNVFKTEDLFTSDHPKPPMPYNRREYYKISLICGYNTAEYADKVIDIEKNALLFASPKIPYHWIPKDQNQSGYFCIFTHDFLAKTKTGIHLEELPIYQPGGCPIFTLSEEEVQDIRAIFQKMYKEISSSYVYKYDMLRNYVIELIHQGQKLQPASTSHPIHTAAVRVSGLFVELLERQFPIETPQERLTLRTAKDYADRLSVHVNHLNKVLKENTGKTTTELIGARILQEAKILLKQTNWNISEIAYALGFEEIAHFSNFFKKQTNLTPLSFRG